MRFFPRRSAPAEVSELREQLGQSHGNLELLTERLAELEDELDGWVELAGESGQHDFSRSGLKRIVHLARIMYLKNPLIQRAVNVQAFYTWAQGVELNAENDAVNLVLQRFLDDPGNKRAFSGEQAKLLNDVTLANEGNLYFVLFPNVVTGHVRIRTIPFDEIVDIISNPEDRSEPWFYKRQWEYRYVAQDGSQRSETLTELYPDARYQPRLHPQIYAGVRVRWERPIYHVRTGGLAGMRFGVPETYASLAWARAYKGFLEDWASLVKSLSRFAWRLTTKNNKVATAKQKLATTVSTDTRETNPPSTAGAAFIGDENVRMDAIPKTGATTSALDGKQLRLMVAASMNIPDTILSGDVDQGNLATSKTLDRPTELAFLARQGMWRDVWSDLAAFVVQASVRATSGILQGQVLVDADGLETVVLADQGDATVTVKFPPILEHDVDATVNAIVAAATLEGHPNAGYIPDRTLSTMLLSALGEKDIDELLDELDQNREVAAAAGITESLVEAIRSARDALVAA